MTELLYDLQRQAALIPRAIILGVLLFIVLLYFEDDASGGGILGALGKMRSNPWRLAFSVYIALILLMTVLIREVCNPYQNILADFNLVKDGKINLEFVKNILLFVPCTFLFHQAFRTKQPLKATLVFTLSVSVFIELCQLLFWLGEFQISDLVFNAVGGMIGYGLWVLMRKALNRIRSRRGG